MMLTKNKTGFELRFKLMISFTWPHLQSHHHKNDQPDGSNHDALSLADFLEFVKSIGFLYEFERAVFGHSIPQFLFRPT
jgi:hypothetical protein